MKQQNQTLEKSKIGTLFIAIAIFLAGYYLFIRYQIKAGQINLNSQSVTFRLFFGYWLWISGFFAALGMALYIKVKKQILRSFSIGFVVLTLINLVTVPFFRKTTYDPLFFGIGGLAMVAIFFVLIWLWAKNRPLLSQHEKIASDFRLIGYYFFICAIFWICGVFGISGYALKPDLAVKLNTQATMIMMAYYILIWFVLGFVFTLIGAFISHRYLKRK